MGCLLELEALTIIMLVQSNLDLIKFIKTLQTLIVYVC